MLKPVMLAAALAATLAVPASATKVKAPADNASVAESRRYFTTDPDAPAIGAARPDVTVVIYTDYQCPYCRKSADQVVKLARADPKVRVLFRDWPIFGKDSIAAARYAIASKYQGKYVPFHLALMKAPRPLTIDKIKGAAAAAGVDWGRLNVDYKAHEDDILDLILRNSEQGEMLNFSGTPGYIIGNFQQFGEMSLSDLKNTVAEARAHAAGKPTTIRKSRKK